MDKQELIEILRSQSATFEEDIERKLDYLNSDEVFSEYVVGLSGDDNDDDEDDEDDDEDDEDEEEDNDTNNEEQKNSEEQNVDDEALKKQKLAAKIAAMRGLASPNFLKK